jgi:PEGA domain
VSKPGRMVKAHKRLPAGYANSASGASATASPTSDQAAPAPPAAEHTSTETAAPATSQPTAAGPTAAAEPAPAQKSSGDSSSAISPAPSSPQTQLQISSTPAGADIEIDGSLVGNTPSTLGVATGQHQLSIKKSGFKPRGKKDHSFQRPGKC